MKSRSLEQKDIDKGEGRRTTPSRKVKNVSPRLSDLLREQAKSSKGGVAVQPARPRRQSDLVRKNGQDAPTVHAGTGSKDIRPKRGRAPLKEASIEHATTERPRRSERLDLDVSEQVFRTSVDTMRGILKEAKARSPLSISKAEKVAELLLHNLQAGDTLLPYVFTVGGDSLDPPLEAVNVCILAVKFGLELGYTTEELRQLSLAALLHDVGMACLPDGLVEKNGPLNPVERASLARHPEEGAQIIRGLGPEYTWLSEVVFQVHERVDGSGYPNALKGMEVQEYAQVIGLADVYESLVHHRPYRRRFSPLEALKEILHRERTTFPDRILKALIQALSPYPVGSLVHLNTGEIGRVVRKNTDHLLCPIVEVLVREGKRVEKPVVTDLSQSPLLNIQDSVVEEALP